MSVLHAGFLRAASKKADKQKAKGARE